MKGIELFEKYRAAGGDYVRLLMTLMYNIGKEIEPLLERAEKEEKKLSIKPESKLHDELVPEDVILV